MNDLAAALGHVRDRITKFRGQAIGEENTKHALIEPVLKALGWDVEDLDEVRCEYKLKASDNPVDYALFVHGNLRLFVEAKALGENLDKWAGQIMGYAGVAGVVEWIALTDGNEYRIYNAHAQVPIQQKLFKRVVLASDDPDVTATLLLLSKAKLQGTVIDDLWRRYFVDRQVKQAVEGLSGIEPSTDFLRLIHKHVPALSLADVRQSLGRATLTLDCQYLQSLDRIHRLGLDAEQETRFTFLLTAETIDEVVDNRVRIKAQRLGQMLEDPNLAAVALPSDEDYVDVIDDPDDVAALFAHLRGDDAP